MSKLVISITRTPRVSPNVALSNCALPLLGTDENEIICTQLTYEPRAYSNGSSISFVTKFKADLAAANLAAASILRVAGS